MVCHCVIIQQQGKSGRAGKNQSVLALFVISGCCNYFFYFSIGKILTDAFNGNK